MLLYYGRMAKFAVNAVAETTHSDRSAGAPAGENSQTEKS